MEIKQTAVELLAILIYSDCQFGGTLDNRISIDKNYLEEIIEQAKAMEKEQRKEDFFAGIKCRYNEPFIINANDANLKHAFNSHYEKWINSTKQQYND